MIIEEIDENLFISRFRDYNRVKIDGQSGGNFTICGLRALFNYLDELYDEENPLKFDVINLCSDYNEFEDLEDYFRDYPLREDYKEDFTDEYGVFDEESFKESIEEDLNVHFTLIKLGDDLNEGFIIGR